MRCCADFGERSMRGGRTPSTGHETRSRNARAMYPAPGAPPPGGVPMPPFPLPPGGQMHPPPGLPPGFVLPPGVLPPPTFMPVRARLVTHGCSVLRPLDCAVATACLLAVRQVDVESVRRRASLATPFPRGRCAGLPAPAGAAARRAAAASAAAPDEDGGLHRPPCACCREQPDRASSAVLRGAEEARATSAPPRAATRSPRDAAGPPKPTAPWRAPVLTLVRRRAVRAAGSGWRTPKPAS